MWVDISKPDLIIMEMCNEAQEIARWDTIDKARSFYQTQNGRYSGYISEYSTTPSTPVCVVKLLKRGEGK